MDTRGNVVVRRTRKSLILLLVLTVVAPAFVAVNWLSGSPASAATLTVLRTKTTAALLASNLASLTYTSATTVVIAQNSPAAIELGSNYAARKGLPLVVSTSGTSPSSVASQLSGWGATQAVLVSSGVGHFTSAFTSSLTASGISTTAYHQSSSVFSRWRSASFESANNEYVLARSDDPSAVSLATSYSLSRGLPMLIWEPATPTADLQSFFAAVNGKSLTFFSIPEVVPTDQMVESQVQKVTTIDPTDAKRAFIWVAGQAQAAGVTSNQVVVAPSDRIADRSLAGLYARKKNFLLAPAGPRASMTENSRATEYLTLWRAEASTVELIGTSLTSADLTSISGPTTLQPTAAPSFRVLNLVRNTSNYSLTLTSVAGATSYTAYDIAMTTVASSATPTLVYAAEQRGMLIVASNSAGEVARLDLRTNEYSSTAMRSSAVLGTTSGGTENLTFLSGIKVPRLITRTTVDPYLSFTDFEEVPVAITCASTFTETGMDQTKQYDYSVIEMSNVSTRACDSAMGALPATSGNLVTSALPLPMTDYGTAMRGQAQTGAAMTTSDITLIDSMPSAESSKWNSTQAIGDDYAPIIVQWMAYIPEAKVPFPGYSGDLSKPTIMFGGDNHGTFAPNESARFKQKLIFTWGTNHSITYSESVGTTYKYKCGLGGCTQTASGNASATELNWESLGSTNVTGSAHVWASATIPLVDGAPAIDTNWVIKLAPGNSVINGNHDNMPQHELYLGTPNAHFDRIYKSAYVSWVQLPCLFVPNNTPLTKCATVFNIQI